MSVENIVDLGIFIFDPSEEWADFNDSFCASICQQSMVDQMRNLHVSQKSRAMNKMQTGLGRTK